MAVFDEWWLWLLAGTIAVLLGWNFWPKGMSLFGGQRPTWISVLRIASVVLLFGAIAFMIWVNGTQPDVP